MRKVQGYVCAVRFQCTGVLKQILYGPYNGEQKRDYDLIELSDFYLFHSVREARALDRYFKRWAGFQGARPMRLTMDIAQTEAEIYSLERKKSLAVIALNSDTHMQHLTGPIVEGKPVWGYIPCAFMIDTEHKPFRSFDPALYAAREINRQGQCGTHMALFSLKPV